jgi:hypothetical protein
MAYQFKTFPCIVPRASLPALVTAKRLLMLLGEHECLNGAGIVVGFYKNPLRFSILTLQYRFRYLLTRYTSWSVHDSPGTGT